MKKELQELQKDKYELLQEKTQRIIVEAERLMKRKKTPNHYCRRDCASCLAAEARGIVDNKDKELGRFGYSILDIPALFSSADDICMLDARNILAEKYKLKII